MATMTQCYDSQSCIRCFSCMVACGMENQARAQRDWNVPIERSAQQAQPQLFHLAPRVQEIGAYPSARRVTTFSHCRHCENAPCKAICPTQAIVTRAAVAFALAMLTSWRRWQLWPEATGIDAIKDGIAQLRCRYLTYTHTHVGKYNMGQKALIWFMIVALTAMMASGYALMLRGCLALEWVGFARFVHALFFMLIVVVLILHVYLATHPINRAGLRAMFGDGELNAEVVQRGNPLCWKKLTQK